MLNPDVDGYTKTLNPRKIHQKNKKQQRVENQKNTETEKSPKWVPVSTYRLLGWIRLFPPLVTPLTGGPNLRLLRIWGGEWDQTPVPLLWLT